MIRGGEAVRGVSGRAGASRGEGAAPRQISDVSVRHSKLRQTLGSGEETLDMTPRTPRARTFQGARALRTRAPSPPSHDELLVPLQVHHHRRHGCVLPTSRLPPPSARVADGTTSLGPRAFSSRVSEGSEPRRHRHRGLPDPAPARLPARASPLLLAPPPPVYPARVRSTSPLPRAVPTRAPAPARFAHSPRPARAPPPFPSPRHAPQASASRACCCSSRTSGSSTSTT